VADEAARVLDADAAEQERPAGFESVGVVADADAHGDGTPNRGRAAPAGWIVTAGGADEKTGCGSQTGRGGGYNGDMAKKRTKSTAAEPPQVYWGADIPMRVIRDFARAVAEKFEPDKIILFGSQAYGTPNADSDVDILVVMPAYNQRSQAYKICLAIPAPFPMDLIVRTPDTLKWRLEEGDSFLREIMSQGKVLYEKTHGRVGAESRSRPSGRGKTAPRPRASS